MRSTLTKKFRPSGWLCQTGLLLVFAMLIGLWGPVGQACADPTAFPSWLEPRGLHIVELVGQVPEDILRDSIVSYSDAVGLVVYKSGTRDGNRVTITTAIYPRVRLAPWAGVLTEFACLGQNPYYDLDSGENENLNMGRLLSRIGNSLSTGSNRRSSHAHSYCTQL